MEGAEKVTHPRLRAVEVFPVQLDGDQLLCLRDPWGFAEQPVFLNRTHALLVSMMNGSNSLRDIQAEYLRQTGEILFMEDLETLVRNLEDYRFLECPSFSDLCQSQIQEFHRSTTRPARHAGAAYEASSEGLRRQIEGFFVHPEGPGPIASADPGMPLRGLIAPHIDFHRGGPTYACAYRALAENPGANRFIVFGTCHNPMQQRFSLTEKSYDTPLGCVETDREFVRSLTEKLRHDYFLDEFAHRGEHSIEFQAVCLRYLLGGSFKIVPVLVGSLHDVCAGGGTPAGNPEIEEMVEAMRQTMVEIPGTYCIVAGADLAHVGRRFGDPSGPSEHFLREVERDDRRFLDLVAAGDAEEVFRSIAADGDRRRVCGYPPIYMTLRSLENPRGKLLQYRQWADFEAGAAVTYASVALF